jgi:hypothetical protein
MLTIHNHHIEAVVHLSEAGSDINRSQHGKGLGMFSFSAAIRTEDLEMVNLVLALSANSSAVDAGGWYLLQSAR